MRMGTVRTIAVIGSGISGLAAAWLLSRRYEVTLFERDYRAGGHSNTVDVPTAGRPAAVDTGFIVYNEAAYPNLVALFDQLGVETAPSDMSFAVSIDAGRYEYSGSGLAGLLGQRSNILSPSHWRMTADILRFFRESRALLVDDARNGPTLGEYLQANRYSRAFVDRHILPMAAAIWSTPSTEVMGFPAASFVKFFANHGLLQARNQPIWRTVVGGSRAYVRRLLDDMTGRVALGSDVREIERRAGSVYVRTNGQIERFDACVVATHADEALGLLADADYDERRLLGAFRYQSNHAVLHRDPSFMPYRRRLWSSWNYLGVGEGAERMLSLTYWMNNLQPLGDRCPDLFVTLNPASEISASHAIAAFDYAHPMFDAGAMAAQRDLWRLQGQRRTWFAGSYFGYGFHEDGLQAGLAAAEDIGGVRRPWRVAGESDRIYLGPPQVPAGHAQLEAAE